MLRTYPTYPGVLGQDFNMLNMEQNEKGGETAEAPAIQEESDGPVAALQSSGLVSKDGCSGYSSAYSKQSLAGLDWLAKSMVSECALHGQKLIVLEKRSRKLEAIAHPVPQEQRERGVYSILFTVPEKNGEWHPILDLKHHRLKTIFKRCPYADYGCSGPSTYVIGEDFDLTL
uniref:Uncharacterized protein n=1 Tax=Sphaerodactylus townsendi TaxID=933632 RepID=A0ACB8FAT6_9SAUR